MSCISWNCRGLGNAATVKELRDLVKRVAPSMLCVQETQVHKARVEGLKTTLGFDHSFAVSSRGHSVGELVCSGEITQRWSYFHILGII